MDLINETFEQWMDGNNKPRMIQAVIGGADAFLEVADDPVSQARGFMHVTSIPKNHGIVFVHGEDVEHGYWMRNVTVPLSIAFVSAQGRIMEVIDMQPMSDIIHKPSKPYRYAIEMARGWFRENCANRSCQLPGILI